MTSDNVQKLIARAVSDAGFRGLLLRKPGEALAGYHLTQEELAALKEALSGEQFDALGGDLGERTSRVGLPLGDIWDAISTVVEAGEPDFAGTGEAAPAEPGAPQGADVTPIQLPGPVSAQGEQEVGESPTPLPEPAAGAEEVGDLPLPVPEPVAGAEQVSALPEPVPEPALGAEEVGTLPEPVPEPALGAAEVGTLPTPIPEPAAGAEEMADLPGPMPEPAAGAEEVGELPGGTGEDDGSGW